MEWGPYIHGKAVITPRRLKRFCNTCPIKFRPLQEVTEDTLPFKGSASASLYSNERDDSASPFLISPWFFLIHVFCISAPLLCGISPFYFLAGCVVCNFGISLEEIKFLPLHSLHKWWKKSSHSRQPHTKQSGGDFLCHIQQSWSDDLGPCNGDMGAKSCKQRICRLFYSMWLLYNQAVPMASVLHAHYDCQVYQVKIWATHLNLNFN